VCLHVCVCERERNIDVYIGMFVGKWGGAFLSGSADGMCLSEFAAGCKPDCAYVHTYTQIYINMSIRPQKNGHGYCSL